MMVASVNSAMVALFTVPAIREDHGIWDFPLFPDQASSGAARVDAIYFGLIVASLVIMALVFGMMLRFAVRYRAGSGANRSNPIRRPLPYEVSWIAALVLISLGLFSWAAWAYFDNSNAPADAIPYYVVGQQWWWEVQHPNGRREMNELHVPVNQRVKLLITSKDVIHSFYIPAFRMKQDALPGRYSTTWFEPTRIGEYHLFCAEYCGTDHARMTGTVYVMSAADYGQWLLDRPAAPTAQPLEPTARASFHDLGCFQCHRPETDALAPRLEGLFGKPVQLSDGATITADEQYIRESILNPAAKLVRGYMPIMPSYQGQLSEQQLAQLVESVRALGDQEQQKPRREIP